jgi:tRNA dimethylallyltransferase
MGEIKREFKQLISRFSRCLEMTGLKPLITICGTTGVGKSKLSIELALKLAQETDAHGWKGARIINADSMQVYTGMDVITNKVPVAERMGVEHLLMDFKQPGEQYVVGEWVRDAIQAVNSPHLFSQSSLTHQARLMRHMRWARFQ